MPSKMAYYVQVESKVIDESIVTVFEVIWRKWLGLFINRYIINGTE